MQDSLPAPTLRKRTATERWGNREGIFTVGFLVVPLKFLSHYSEMGLSANEAMFVLQLMTFKWDLNSPYPTYATLAARMGVSEKMVRRYARNLERKSLLKRRYQSRSANKFELSGLFDAIAQMPDTRVARISSARNAPGHPELSGEAGFLGE